MVAIFWVYGTSFGKWNAIVSQLSRIFYGCCGQLRLGEVKRGDIINDFIKRSESDFYCLYSWVYFLYFENELRQTPYINLYMAYKKTTYKVPGINSSHIWQYLKRETFLSSQVTKKTNKQTSSSWLTGFLVKCMISLFTISQLLKQGLRNNFCFSSNSE